MNIEKLGFDKWFKDKINPAKLADYQIFETQTVREKGGKINGLASFINQC